MSKHVEPEIAEQNGVELAGMRRLYELHTKLANEISLKRGLDEILAVATEFTGTDLGILQLASADGERLEIIASRGFAPDSAMIRHFQRAGSKAACDAARDTGRRIIVQNVETHPDLIGTPDAEIALAEGVRATLNVPMVTPKGLIGVLNVQFHQPHRPSEEQIQLMDLLAVTAAGFVTRYRTETALREAERRQEFLLRLNDAMRSLAAPSEIEGEACRLLAEHLEVDRAYYVQIDQASGTARVERDFVRGGAPSLAGEHRVSDFAWSIDTLSRDRHVIDDTQTSELVPPPHRPASAALGIIACAGAPLIKAGRLVGALCVTLRRPRQWTEAEVFVLHDVAERIWEAVERARSESALQESEERLRLATELASIGYWDVDPVRDVLIWPPRVKAMFGIPPNVPVSMADFYACLHPDDRERVSAAFAAASDPAKRALYEVEYRTVGKEDGLVRWVAARGRGLFDESGQCIRVIGIAIEITDRKQAEQALLRTEKLATLGRMAASVAHEINNPLEAVTNLLYLTRMEQGLSSSAAANLDLADSELSRIAHIARQSLGFYRESSGPTLTSIADVLNSSIALLKARFTAKNATVTREWKTDLSLVAIPGELRQVFSNLLVNSLDAMEPGGKIRLRAAKCTTAFDDGRPCVRITLADSGKGIATEARRRIFDPLFTTKGSVGTGLGLWVSRQIVEKHGGMINMRTCDKGPRTGTVFCIILPEKSPL